MCDWMKFKVRLFLFVLGERYKNRLEMTMRPKKAIYPTSRPNPMKSMGEKTVTQEDSTEISVLRFVRIRR